MVDVRVAVDDWGLVGVLWRHSHREIELSANPYTILLARQVHRQPELHDVGLVDTHGDERWLVQILHVLRQPDLTR